MVYVLLFHAHAHAHAHTHTHARTHGHTDTRTHTSVDEVRGQLEAGRTPNFRHREDRLKHPLRCHVCREVCKNMPTLKSHIAKHL